jgi:hypothetical protein
MTSFQKNALAYVALHCAEDHIGSVALADGRVRIASVAVYFDGQLGKALACTCLDYASTFAEVRAILGY